MFTEIDVVLAQKIVYQKNSYFITVTFPDFLSLKRKMVKVNRFHSYMKTRGAIRVLYSMEYHKYQLTHRNYIHYNDVTVGVNDNPFKPHIHALVTFPTENNFNIKWILKDLRDDYGNTKIDYLNEDADYQGCLEYMLKDSDRLFKKYGIPHLWYYNKDQKEIEEEEFLHDVNVIENESDEDQEINGKIIKCV